MMSIGCDYVWLSSKAIDKDTHTHHKNGEGPEEGKEEEKDGNREDDEEEEEELEDVIVICPLIPYLLLTLK